MSTKKLSALNASNWFDFIGLDAPKCPHCGDDYDISEGGSYQVYEAGEHELSCPKCEHDFAVTTRCHYTFSTDSQESSP